MISTGSAKTHAILQFCWLTIFISLTQVEKQVKNFNGLLMCTQIGAPKLNWSRISSGQPWKIKCKKCQGNLTCTKKIEYICQTFKTFWNLWVPKWWFWQPISTDFTCKISFGQKSLKLATVMQTGVKAIQKIWHWRSRVRIH